MSRLKQGLVQVYTGNGKGKTTAAIGLAVRAAGAGLKVCIQQFAKRRYCAEVKVLKKIEGIQLSRCGRSSFIIGKPAMSDIRCAKKGFEGAKRNLFSKKFDLVVLDEINVAMDIGLIRTGEVEKLIKNKPESVELVLTGRNCPSKIRKLADYVCEIKDIKHPYRHGIECRAGIES